MLGVSTGHLDCQSSQSPSKPKQRCLAPSSEFGQRPRRFSRASRQRQDFGVHWDEIKASRYDGGLSDEALEKMCRFARVVKSCGVPASELSRRQMRKPLKWRTGVIKSKTRKLCKKVRERLATRQRVTEHYPASHEEGTQVQACRPDNTAADPADDRSERPATLDNDNTAGGPANDRSVNPNVDPWHPPPPMVAVGPNLLDGFHAIYTSTGWDPRTCACENSPRPTRTR